MRFLRKIIDAMDALFAARIFMPTIIGANLAVRGSLSKFAVSVFVVQTGAATNDTPRLR